MKQVAVFFTVFLVGVVLARPQEKYTSKYDNIDLDSIFKSERLLTNYINCLMDRGKCTPDAAELKAVLPDALQTDCSKCSEGQKKMGKRVVEFMTANKPDVWKELEAKYDPEGIYRKKYGDELEKIKSE